MATKSIYKSIDINSNVFAEDLVNAIEDSKSKKDKDITFAKDVIEVKGKDIKNIWK